MNNPAPSACTSTYVVGIDVGGTKIRAGLADADGGIVTEVVAPTHPQGSQNLVAQLVDVVGELARAHGIRPSQVAATGIGGAGVPNDTAGFDLAPNLGATEHGLAEELEAALGHTVLLENDVNVAAVGELHEGMGREVDDFVFVAVGTGIGMGVIVGGALVRGATGAAGEIGYLPVGADPFEVANHRRGSLEERVAGHTLAERYERSTGRSISTRDVFDRVGLGDRHAIAAVDDESRYLALALVSVNAVLDPDVFVLGGGIGSRPELLAPLRSWLGRLGSPALDIRFSELGHRAPVIGAARLALEHVHSRTLVKGLIR